MSINTLFFCCLTLGVPAGVIFARSAVYVYGDKKWPVLQGLRLFELYFVCNNESLQIAFEYSLADLYQQVP